MFSALFSFLGGSVFRMIWGEVASWVQKKQEHAQEIERMQAEAGLEAARHERDMSRIRLQSDLGIKEVTIAGDLAIQKTEADAFVQAIRAASVPTGVKWVDGWNGAIRPVTASIALLLWAWNFAGNGFVMTDWDRDLMGVAIGFYFADRSLSRRAK